MDKQIIFMIAQIIFNIVFLIISFIFLQYKKKQEKVNELIQSIVDSLDIEEPDKDEEVEDAEEEMTAEEDSE